MAFSIINAREPDAVVKTRDVLKRHREKHQL